MTIEITKGELSCLIVGCAILAEDIDRSKSLLFTSRPVSDLGIKLIRLFENEYGSVSTNFEHFKNFIRKEILKDE